mmetsp:Transcript_55771/g.135141  ORF Transcript_55771/g.135141 Transcript_55771/m.135141 type:complete len:215 (-) Transcript_55771:375-1019(-)
MDILGKNVCVCVCVCVRFSNSSNTYQMRIVLHKQYKGSFFVSYHHLLCFTLVASDGDADIPFFLYIFSSRFRSVPHGYSKNPRLAQWVKRQRHYYRRKHCLTASKINCKSSSGSASPVSSLTDRRESALNRLGFCWNSHNELWNQRFVDLQKYKEKFGDCNVPINYADNKQLAVWTKTQRRQYKCYTTGRKSKITPERIDRLNAIGFSWNPRNL